MGWGGGGVVSVDHCTFSQPAFPYEEAGRVLASKEPRGEISHSSRFCQLSYVPSRK